MDAELDREITDFELSEITGLARVTLQMKRKAGTGPVFKKYPNRSVRYRMSDVKAWMDAAPRRRSTTEHLAAV